MSKYIIETKNLTKQYGTQKSAADLNVHVRKGRIYADDIGIIDHGVLLEEESFAELEARSSRHIRFAVSSTTQEARILERSFHETQFIIQDDHNLRLHNLEVSVGEIITAFVENGLEVSEAYICEESLEDYFRRVTGGEGIA